MIRFERIVPEAVAALWPYAEPMLAKSFFRKLHVYGVDDLYPLCLTGHAQLWMAFEDNRPLAAVVTMLEEGPKAKACSVLNLGGEEMEKWIGLLDEAFVAFCRENGCIGYEAVTRPGFSKHVPGFVADGTVYVKLIDGDN